MSVEEPISPVTPIDEAAILAHEMYTSYVSAGFNEVQALDLVKTLMSQMAKDAGSGSGG